MATDNVTLNAGTGGASIRTFADADGNEWPASVLAYATTVTAGANVLTPVSQDTPLPVESTIVGAVVISSVTGAVAVVNDDPANLLATISIAADQTLAAVTSITNPVAVTQSGSWTFTLDSLATVGTITNPVKVFQDTAGDLLCTASQGGTWNIGTVSTIANPVTVNIASAQTLATVTNVTTVGTITNAVTVTQATAANLKATVSLAASQTLDTVTNVTTVGTITNPVAVTQSGTWNAGLSAGTNLIGKTATGLDTATIYSGTTALTPKFAKISASTSGDNQIVAAVTGKKIRVLRWGLTASGTVGVKWRSNTTDLTGVQSLVQYASAGASFCPVGVFETAAGEALNLNLSAAVAVGGVASYIEV